MIVLALALACGGDAELRGMGRALAAWEEGVEALESGEAVAAGDHFRRAREHRPDDAVLGAWEARALAQGGDPEGAAALLEEVLERWPGFGQARYNRAAYLARAGRIEEAAPELRLSIDQGASSSRAVLVDPDFQPWLGHPALAFLPAEYLKVVLEVPDGAVFAGNELDLVLRVVGVDDPPVRVTPGPEPVGLELVRVVEDVVPSTQGPQHDLSYTLRASTEGVWSVGPLEVEAGGHATRVGPATVEVAAAPGAVEGEGAPLDMVTPLGLRGQPEVPSVGAWAGDLVVFTDPGDRVAVEPRGAPEPLRYEYRERGHTRWVAHRYPGYQAETVRVLRAGQVVLEEAP